MTATSTSTSTASATRSRSDPQARADLCAFLAALGQDAFAGSFFELRARYGESMRSRFIPVRFRDQAASAILRASRDRDVYLGVAPRARRAGGRQAIPYLTTLWVDADTSEAIERVQAFAPAPSILISSGRGQHAYWLLEHPTDVLTGERANHRLAQHLRADLNCWDAPRILRAPHTRNYRHQPPRPVQLLRLAGDKRHPLDAILLDLPQRSGPGHAPAPRSRQTASRATTGDPLLAIEPARYITVLLGVQVGRDRKISCPFHPDQHPSLHVYPNPEQGWHCFACRRGGSIYDLASGLWLSGQPSGAALRGRKFLEVRERLLVMFGPEIARARGESRGFGRGDDGIQPFG